MPRKKKMNSDTAREYQELMDKLGLNQEQTCELLEFAPRTSRRYKRGEVEVPAPTLKLMRLMARGVVSKRQVADA
jgi:hypothetical protein